MTDFVPRWLLRKLVYSGGFRLDEAARFKVAEEKKPVVGFGPIYKGKINGPFECDRHKITVMDPIMGFETWEYRFWSVDVIRDKPTMATCRFCQKLLFTANSRKQHIKEKKCTTKLIVAYGLLLKDSKCVICDKYTTNKKWGVPMCEKGLCIDLWMHDEAQPTGLENAIMFADKQGLIGD